MNLRILAFLTLLVGCSASHFQVTILHTNDIHGHFLSEPSTWREDSALVGGFAALSGALDSVRRADEHSIYIDAGDLMTGNPICNIPVDDVQGGALVKMLRFCDCDAISIGNHEFDLGPDHLKSFLAIDDLNWVCGNVTWRESQQSLCQPFVIIDRGGLRIGVIGLLLNDLYGVVSKSAVAPFEVSDIAVSAQEYINEIDSKTDLIVLLTHNGLQEDKELARLVHGADIIVGGHSHTRLTEPIIENGIVIVQAGSNLKNLGVLKVEVANDRVTKHEGSLVELEASRFLPGDTLVEYIEGFESEIKQVYGQQIAVAQYSIERRYAETSPLGNLLCDLLRDSYDMDIAIVNSGGIRKDLAAGAIRKLDIVEMLPFFNTVTLFEASGAELLTFASRQISAAESGKTEILQMSGLEIRYKQHVDSVLTVTCTINGQPVDSAHIYRGVSIDYVLKSQWEKYLGFQPRIVEDTGILFSDFITASIASLPQPVLPNNEIRLIKEFE